MVEEVVGLLKSLGAFRAATPSHEVGKADDAKIPGAIRNRFLAQIAPDYEPDVMFHGKQL